MAAKTSEREMRMKRFCSLLCLAALAAALLLLLNGCGASAATADTVYGAVEAAFTEKYGHGPVPSAPVPVDETILQEKFGLTEAETESYRGEIAGMMTNCDMLLVVQAKDGKGPAVEAALEKALENQKAAFQWYAVMDNPERLDAAKIVSEGDFYGLLLVGVSPEDPDGEKDFAADVTLAEKAFREAAK